MPLPESLTAGIERADLTFEITDSFGEKDYWEAWDSERESHHGITGFWFPHASLMVVGNRAVEHHNVAMGVMDQRDALHEPLIPWAADYTANTWHVDVPTSGGGVYQYLAKNDMLDDFRAWRSGAQIEAHHVWPPIKACRLCGIPDDALVNAQFQPRRMASADPNYTEQVSFEIGEAYTELRFAPGGLPEPTVDRQQYL